MVHGIRARSPASLHGYKNDRFAHPWLSPVVGLDFKFSCGFVFAPHILLSILSGSERKIGLLETWRYQFGVITLQPNPHIAKLERGAPFVTWRNRLSCWMGGYVGANFQQRLHWPMSNSQLWLLTLCFEKARIIGIREIFVWPWWEIGGLKLIPRLINGVNRT